MPGLLCLPFWCVQAMAADELPPIQAGSTVEEVKPGRLKFRKGPTCMCVKGTSEADIAAAEERRKAERDARIKQAPAPNQPAVP